MPGGADQRPECQHPGLLLGLCGRRADPERACGCCPKGELGIILIRAILYLFHINGTVDLSRFFCWIVVVLPLFIPFLPKLHIVLYKSIHFSQFSVPMGFFYVNPSEKLETMVFLD